MNTKFLKDKTYYEDLYDRHTIEKALWYEDYFLNRKNSKSVDPDWCKRLAHISLYFICGERYINRKSTIQEWIDDDFKKDQKFYNTPIPTDISCILCNNEMTFFDKYLFDSDVTFVFKCTDCKVAADIKNNIRKNIIPWQCPDCKKRLVVNTNKVKKKIISVKICDFCGYKNKYVLDLSENIEERKEASKDDVKEFNENKLRFCLSEKEGLKYIESKNSLNKLQELLKKSDVNKVKKEIEVLSIKQVHNQLKLLLKKDGFEKIRFSDPDISRDIIFKFSAIDSKERSDYDLRTKLCKVIKTYFKDSNWNLMSEGIEARLGIVKGRMRGKERTDMSLQNIIL